MPRIDIGIFTHANQTSLDRTRREIKDSLDQMSRDASPDLLQGLDEKLPKVRQAFLGLADATDAWSRSTRALKENQDRHNEALEKAGRLQGTLNDLNVKAGILNNEAVRQQESLNEARRAEEPITQRQIKLDEELRQLKAQHSETTKQLADNAVLHTIAEEDLRQLRLQSADEAKRLRDLTIEKSAIDQVAAQHTAEVAENERALRDIRAEHTRTLKELTDAQREQDKQSQIAVETARREADIHDNVAQAARRREESLRRVTEAETEHNRRSSGFLGGLFGGGGDDGSGGGGGGVGGAFRGILPGGARAGAGAYALAAPIVGSLAEAAVTAGQSLAVLPAVAAAGAAGLLTLKIGFDDLGKAITDVGDPKKFAKDLESLGPAAQQVALEIQFLTQGPLKELKAAVEESLFKGVPETLHNLTNSLLPEVKQLTTGVGDAFNGMFKNFAGQLTTPESMKSISEIINNIVTAFHNLEPAVAPFIDALTKITQVGSSFLPGFATSIADAARAFDNFITKAQQSGDLHRFIQQGVDAAKVLGQELSKLGGYIYEVFGHKEPGDFKKTIDDLVESLKVVGNAIMGASKLVNEFLRALQDVANMVGGYDNLFAIAFGIFTGVKFVGILSSVSKLAGLLGDGAAGEIGVAGALKGLPAIADTAAGGIAAALAKVAVPAWLSYLVGQQNPAIQPSVPLPDGSPQFDINAPGGADAAQQYLHQVHGDAPASGIPGGGGPGAQRDRYGKRQPGPIATSVDPGGPPPAPTWFPTAGLDPYHPFPVPNSSDYDSDSKKKAAALAGIDPNKFAVDPFAGLPPGSVPQNTPGQPGASGSASGGPAGADGKSYGPLEYGTNGKPFQKPGFGYQMFNDDAILSRIDALQKDAEQIQVAGVELEGLKQSGVATQLDLLKAENKLQDEKRNLTKDQAALLKEEQGHWEKVQQDKAQKIKDLGPGLDPDLGLGQGLAGLLDNMIKFAGTMAMAPTLASLDATTQADPIKGGYGLLGVNGAKNIANGLSPLLGQPYGVTGNLPPESYTNQGVSTTPTPFGTSATVGSPLVGPGGPGTSPNGFRLNAPEQALSVNGVSTQDAAGGPAERLQQFAQWFNDNIEPVKELAGYDAGGHGLGNRSNHTSGSALDINWSDFTALQGNGADARTHFSPDQMQAISQELSAMGMTWGQYWSPDSRDPGHFELGGAPYANKGPQNVDPTTGQPSSPVGMSGLTAGPSYSGSATPVFVVNMPGGGIGGSGGGTPFGSPASGQGGGPLPGPANDWLSQQLLASGLSPDETKGILAMNTVEGGATNPKSLLGFTEGQAQGPTGHLDAFLNQWNDPKRRSSGGGIPGVGADGQVADWDQYMTWIREKIVGQNGAPGQPSPSDYQSRLMKALGAPGSNGPADLSDIHTNGSMGGPGGFANAPVFSTPPLGGPSGQGGGGIFAGPYGNGPTNAGGAMPIGPIGPLGGGGGIFAGPYGNGPTNASQPNIGGVMPLGPAGQLGAPGGLGGTPTPPIGGGAQKPVGGTQPGGWQPSGPGAGADGGALGAAAGAASMGLDAIAPGAGQAAQTATKLINRTIQFGGQLGAIGVEGLMETFGLSGSSLGDPSKSWPGRLAAGFAQAKPATPSSAGQTQAPVQQQQQQVDPNTQQHGTGGGQPPGPTVNIENYHQGDGQNGQSVFNDLAHQAYAAWGRP